MAEIKLSIKKRFFNEVYLPYLSNPERLKIYLSGLLLVLVFLKLLFKYSNTF